MTRLDSLILKEQNEHYFSIIKKKILGYIKDEKTQEITAESLSFQTSLFCLKEREQVKSLIIGEKGAECCL